MKLSIAEGLYLIALDDEEGRLLTAAEHTITPGIVSSCILDLYIQKKIKISKGVIQVLDPSGTGNVVLDRVLHKLHSGTPLTKELEVLDHEFKDIQKDLDQLLVQRGILKREETKLLWIPLSERMDNANYAFEQEIRNILKAIVFKSAKPTPSFAVLLTLIHCCGILEEVFPEKDDLADATNVAKNIPATFKDDPELAYALMEMCKFFNA